MMFAALALVLIVLFILVLLGREALARTRAVAALRG